MAREWVTLQQMGEEEGITENTLRQATRGWDTERRAADAAAEPIKNEIFINDYAQMRADMMKRQMAMALALQAKGINHLLGKVRDKKTGRLVERPFTSESIALGAARLGISVEQSLLRSAGLPTAGMAGALGPIIDVDGTDDSYRTQLRTITDPQQLLQYLKSLDDDADDEPEEKNNKGRGGRAGGGKNKRS